ncbi:hypothetical protein C3L33_23038, partial [Rhododendron williamsianum]
MELGSHSGEVAGLFSVRPDPTRDALLLIVDRIHSPVPKVSGLLWQVKVERMRGRAHDKLMNKLAAATHKAEEKRAAAEAKKNRQATKTEQQAEYIRTTGRMPSSFSCGCCCC